MGIKEKAIVVGYASIILAVASTIHTAPFGVGPAAQIRDNRPESGAVNSADASGSSGSKKAGSVWKNLDKKIKENKT